MKFIIYSFIFLLGISQSAFAGDLQNLWAQMEKNRKGPFTINYLVGTSSRHAVTAGSTPSGFLFQAAFRNEVANQLAQTHGFYIGNLFTTNYYELMGAYVYNDRYSNHGLDHQALIAKGPQISLELQQLVSHWVLERHYLEYFPQSKLAQSFALRGISGSEFEQEFAYYFFELYFNSITDEMQYLPALLLLKESPVGSSASLDKARLLVAQSYDFFLARWGAQDPRVKRLYVVRNAIHNALSADIVQMIDQYVADFPFYKAEKHTYLFKVKEILIEFYSSSADKIAKQAKNVGATTIREAAEEIVKSGASVERLLKLSFEAAQLRAQISQGSVALAANKTDLVLLLNAVSQYLNKELTSQKTVTDKRLFEVLVDIAYLEGFLIYDNWQYFRNEVESSSDAQAAAMLMADVFTICQSTLMETFNVPLAQWTSIESKMEYFVDDTLKSSSVNTISLMVERVQP